MHSIRFVSCNTCVYMERWKMVTNTTAPFYTHPILDALSRSVYRTSVHIILLRTYRTFFNRPVGIWTNETLNAPRVERIAYCILCLANRYTWCIECGTKCARSLSLSALSQSRITLMTAYCLNVLCHCSIFICARWACNGGLIFRTLPFVM